MYYIKSMQKRSSKDVNVIAASIVEQAYVPITLTIYTGQLTTGY